jgi:hypothetical protein
VRTGHNGLLLALAIFASRDSFAFQQQTDRLCSIQGTVTNLLTKEPLRKAYLRLVPRAGGKQDSRSLTDQEGKFTFEGLLPGLYGLEAGHQGFLDSIYSDEGGSVIEIGLNAGDKIGGRGNF